MKPTWKTRRVQTEKLTHTFSYRALAEMVLEQMLSSGDGLTTGRLTLETFEHRFDDDEIHISENAETGEHSIGGVTELNRAAVVITITREREVRS